MNLAARTRKALHSPAPARRSFGETWVFIRRRGPETTVRSTTNSIGNYPAVFGRRKSLDHNCSRNACVNPPIVTKGNLAEGAGFEPAIRFPAYTLSRRAPSAARPPLRVRAHRREQRAYHRAGRRASRRVRGERRNGRSKSASPPLGRPRIAHAEGVRLGLRPTIEAKRAFAACANADSDMSSR